MKAGHIKAEDARHTDYRFPRGRFWYRWIGKVRGWVLLVHETPERRRQVSVKPERRLVAQRRLSGV